MKQSSIEWLMEIDKSRAITIEEWQQAKAMHKEEIKNAIQLFGYMGAEEEAEQYYNETFNTISLNPTKWSETFNTNQENLPDSTNGYTYYPRENKTVFNTKGK